MLGELSGGRHEVLTGVALWVEGQDVVTLCERTVVNFARLTEEEIAAYVETGEPMDKSGGYGIQSKGALLVESIEGDYFNVVGFPLAAFSRLLAGELDRLRMPASETKS
eukprot:gnl/TRDRNA2_/TRDRNA2_165704_c0_seq1.p1 gnl/TRDRNA2_/TRDRNA2_165704_c0~~gnl/TRDRNA2_/TRDRNA2_165704_c0_seq1.p1  ORF type:complete len:109 (-),score=24.62 gnl/TRDRNA2_/TRDRNA2_165704_c0_seq1:118-444(-)